MSHCFTYFHRLFIDSCFKHSYDSHSHKNHFNTEFLFIVTAKQMQLTRSTNRHQSELRVDTALDILIRLSLLTFCRHATQYCSFWTNTNPVLFPVFIYSFFACVCISSHCVWIRGCKPTVRFIWESDGSRQQRFDCTVWPEKKEIGVLKEVMHFWAFSDLNTIQYLE